jgi:glutamate-5-semialdehyde dehydrogenase
MKANLQEKLRHTKRAALVVSRLSTEKKNQILYDIAENIARNKHHILQENKRDVVKAQSVGLGSAFVDRLTLDDGIFAQMVDQIKQIAKLPDPVGKVIEQKVLKNGMKLKKVGTPLGVIGVIYESRPNVTVDVAALAIKSGNTAVLKGGPEAINSNRALVNQVHKALLKNDVPTETIVFLDTTDRRIVDQMLKQRSLIDVIVSRGGYELTKKVAESSTIPVLYHSAGGARIYIDESADLNVALRVCINAKTNRPAACNSLDTIVVHKKIARQFIGKFCDAMKLHGVEALGDAEARKIVQLKKATKRDWDREFLNLVVAIKVVENVDRAIEFIRKHSKGHSEGIIAENQAIVKKFTESIDAAALFVNCSTRLHDGWTFGLGAEVGISTGKLHARGPTGLKEITTYKWIAYGQGQVRQ